jgi:hypothetical protein
MIAAAAAVAAAASGLLLRPALTGNDVEPTLTIRN